MRNRTAGVPGRPCAAALIDRFGLGPKRDPTEGRPNGPTTLEDSMSQIPPGASSSWLDPYGRQQPGTPPPGYWQANDGRWYPPNPAPAAPPSAAPDPGAQTQIAHPQPGGPPSFGAQAPSEPSVPFNDPVQGFQATPVAPSDYSPPPNFAPPTPEPKKSRAALFGILGVIAFLFVGCSALGLVALNRAGDAAVSTLDSLVTTVPTGDETDGSLAPGEVTTVAPSDDTETSDTTARSLAGVTTSTPSGDDSGAGVDGDTFGCTVADEDTIVLEVVNSTDVTQTYFLTIALFEGSERQGDTVAFVNNLRPGERTIEESFLFDQEGSACEVVDSDTFTVDSDPDHLADVPTCDITGSDTFGDVAAEVSATNSSSATSDYTIQVAFVGTDGVRRGTGFATIESVEPGASAPTDVFTLVDEEVGLTCEVVGVDRVNS